MPCNMPGHKGRICQLLSYKSLFIVIMSVASSFIKAKHMVNQTQDLLKKKKTQDLLNLTMALLCLVYS